MEITHNAYEEIGQVEGALAQHANAQYDRCLSLIHI